MANYNFFGTGMQDPVLNSNMEEFFKSLENVMGEYRQKREQLAQIQQPQQMGQQPQSNTPVWDEIDKALADLSDKEFERVASDVAFVESQQAIMAILQAVQLKMMRPMVEGTPEGKKALEEHLQLVKHLKRTISKEVNEEMKEFDEYRNHYSHLSWEDYQAQKSGKKGGKK